MPVPIAVYRPKMFGSPASTLLIGLQECWNFQEDSGDATGLVHGNVLTDATGGIGTAAGPSVLIPKARSLVAASSQYFAMSSNADVQMGTGDWTWALWFRYVSTNLHTLLGKYGGTLPEFVLVCNNDVLTSTIYGGVGGGVTWTPNLVAGTWYAIRMDYTKATAITRLQINNAAPQSHAAGATVNNSDSPFIVGYLNTVGRYLNGRIAVLCKWNRVLTDAEWVEYQIGKLWPF